MRSLGPRFLALWVGQTVSQFGNYIAVITVPTPLKETVPDLSYIEAASRQLAPWVTEGATVVLESTTYPGTTEQLVVPLLEAGSGLRSFYYADWRRIQALTRSRACANICRNIPAVSLPVLVL